MERKLIIAGIGGQGVIYATKVISQAALLGGHRVLASENHGMSQRGGSVNSHVHIGAGEGTLIRRGAADALLAFDVVEALRNVLYVRAGGALYVNTAGALPAPVTDRLRELGTGVFLIDAAATAKSLGSPAAANLVVLGRAAAQGHLGLSVDEIKAAVRVLGPARAVSRNYQAVEAGANHYAPV